MRRQINNSRLISLRVPRKLFATLFLISSLLWSCNLSPPVALSGHREEVRRKAFCLLKAWQYKLVRKIIRSTITAETLAFLDAAEAGIFYPVLLGPAMSVLEESIDIKCYVDN